MIFTSFEFLLFFALVVLVKSCLRNYPAQKWFLLGASCLFYVTWSAPCLLLILSTAISDYSIGVRMGKTTEPRIRKRLLIASMTINLALLAFFKYSNFFLTNIAAALNGFGAHVGSPHLNIILPPAISFFTFTSMAYVLDVYFEKIPVCDSARDYALFIAFFPKVLSGPITRGGELLPQFKAPPRVTAEDVETGLSYFLIGAVKKLVIADQIAGPVGQIFAAPAQFDAPTLLMGVLGYGAQIYCDFSGYSDMAIGSARILGFKLPENFEMPFSSRNITEFWRRWHITMSRWFRDYLFLPMEIATRDNPNPALRLSINMTITMLLCGLWHGPNWTFVAWGGIHGAALSAHTVWTKWKGRHALERQPFMRLALTITAHLLTLGVVVLGFVFFRAETMHDAFVYLARLASGASTGTRLSSPYIAAGVVAVIATHFLVGKNRNLQLELSRMSLAARIISFTLLVTVIVLLGATEATPFIYFKF
jgi:alginate O-acetyltransferase complex protein AlgI